MVKKIMTFMNWLKFRGVPSIALFLVLTALVPPLSMYAATTCTSWNWCSDVYLRTDIQSITNAFYMDYKHSINIVPFNAPFGAEKATFNVTIDDSQRTIQAGYTVHTDDYNNPLIQWFVYDNKTIPNINCWRGTPITNGSGVTTGCMGVIGDWVQVNSWLDVQTVTYEGQSWWIVRFYNQNGIATDVAKINSSSKRVNEVKITTDLPLSGSGFYHLNPRQKTSFAPLNFQTWSASSGGHNNYLTTGLTNSGGNVTTCGQDIGTTTNIAGLGYYWRTWQSGPTCFANPLF